MVETNITKRWEQGIRHHPKSIEIFQTIEDNDQKYGGDYFCWKKGGAGDNGEHLMYLLDIYFEQQDETLAERKAKEDRAVNIIDTCKYCGATPAFYLDWSKGYICGTVVRRWRRGGLPAGTFRSSKCFDATSKTRH